MADSNFVLARGFDVVSGATIVKNRAVKAGAAAGDPQVDVIAASTDVPLGVAAYGVTPAEALKGKGATVNMSGIVEMESLAAIVVGALVTISPNGRAKTGAAGERVIGVCVGNPSGGAGEIVSVLLSLPGFLHP